MVKCPLNLERYQREKNLFEKHIPLRHRFVASRIVTEVLLQKTLIPVSARQVLPNHKLLRRFVGSGIQALRGLGYVLRVRIAGAKVSNLVELRGFLMLKLHREEHDTTWREASAPRRIAQVV